jgi:hypothetical protein
LDWRIYWSSFSVERWEDVIRLLPEKILEKVICNNRKRLRSLIYNLLMGVWVSIGVPEMSHVLFVDDCFLFCRDNITEVYQFPWILHTYEKVLGQEINLSKSEAFISCNMSHVAKEDLSDILGVQHVLGTCTYLWFTIYDRLCFFIWSLFRL